ncbi:MAG: cellulose biosynthesis cyclic di-GMP-binding regulatory protein BcsB [Gammaproteobacteria bacterium]
MHNINLTVFLFFMLAFVQPALSEEANPTLNKTWQLDHFMINDEPIMLKNVSGSYSVSFPISDRVEPESVDLILSISNSNLLHDKRAQVAVFINDYLVGQIKLSPIDSETRAQFTIAKEYLVNGYNQLTIKAAQHYTDSQCEDWSAPELWTSINSVKSTLTLNYHDKPVAESLAELDSLLNDRLDTYSASILRVDNSLTEAYLYWGSMLAQGIKLRLKYVPLALDEKLIKPYQWPEDEGRNAGRFNIDPEQLKNDAILIGTKEQLNPLIPEDISQAIQGAYLGLFRQDINPQRFILIVSGVDNQQVKRAAQAFALLNMPLPDAAQTIIEDINLADLAGVSRQTIMPGTTYQFSQLGFADQTFDVVNTDAHLELRLPPDMYSTEEAMVTLNLDLAYGAAMRKDSVINISLNGLFNHAVQLKEQSGAHYNNYQIQIPLRNFQAGVNRLSFDAVLTPSEYGECTFIQRGNLIASLYRDSTITFPETGHVASLPDLKLFERTGFPLLKNGSMDDTVFNLVDRSSDSRVSAWHFIAKLAAINGAPLFGSQITWDKTVTSRNRVWIGKPEKETTTLFEGAPVRLGLFNQFPYPFKEKQRNVEEPLPEWLYSVFSGETRKPLAAKIEPENVVMLHGAGLGQKFLFMSYPSPNVDGGLDFALLSEPAHSLYAGMIELLSPELWSQMQGNVFVWDKRRNFNWLQDGATFVTGEGSTRLSLIMHFSRHPWHWLALIVSVLVLIAWLIHTLLARYKRQTHRPANENAN